MRKRAVPVRLRAAAVRPRGNELCIVLLSSVRRPVVTVSSPANAPCVEVLRAGNADERGVLHGVETLRRRSAGLRSV